MFSRQIDLTGVDIHRAEAAKDERRADNYRNDRRRSTLPKELQNGSLKALKKLLADAKAKSADEHSVSTFTTSNTISPSEVTPQRGDPFKLNPSSQVMELYHNLLDKLILTNREGIQKTTFNLDSAAFRSSVFRGATVTLVEYSTAPKIFNIQFTADPKAVAFFELHAADLQNALNNGKHNFDIGRINTSLQNQDEQYAIEAVEADPEEDEYA
jgi:hypothetical protein